MIQFNKKRGLCGNIVCMYPSTIELSVLKEMRMQFTKSGLDMTHPFGEADYNRRNMYRSMHLCPKRLAWAKDHYQYPPHDQSKELTEFYGAWYKWSTNEGDSRE